MRGNFSGREMPFRHCPGFVGILLCIGVIVVVVFVVKALLNKPKQANNTTPVYQNPPTQAVSTDSALRILDERYAKGEIDDTEYKTKKENILGIPSGQ